MSHKKTLPHRVPINPERVLSRDGIVARPIGEGREFAPDDFSYVDWVIHGELARSARPSYPSKEPRPESVLAEVASWQVSGIRSVLCLLSSEQLAYYATLDSGLLDFYQSRGLVVGHVPIVDHCQPPVSESEMQQVLKVYETLPKPCLVHCSAGIDRTGAVVEAILRQ